MLPVGCFHTVASLSRARSIMISHSYCSRTLLHGKKYKQTFHWLKNGSLIPCKHFPYYLRATPYGIRYFLQASTCMQFNGFFVSQLHLPYLVTTAYFLLFWMWIDDWLRSLSLTSNKLLLKLYSCHVFLSLHT
jgi:hypothetical protein